MRIQLGDIEIDGNVVRIGGAPQVPEQHAIVARTSSLDSRATTSLDTSAMSSLQALPVSGRALRRVGTILLGCALVALAVFPPTSLLSLLLHILPLMAGASLFGLGVVKRFEERREERHAEIRAQAELEPHILRVRGALSEPKLNQTVEWLAANLQLSEATVVRALDQLRKQGELEEELNVDNGEWYYSTRRELAAGQGDLESRMAALKKGKAE